MKGKKEKITAGSGAHPTGGTQSLSFIIFLSVLCLLVYLFAFYLFTAKGVLNQFGLENRRDQLADNIALVSLDTQASIAGGNKVDDLLADEGFIGHLRDIGSVDQVSPFVYDTDGQKVIWPLDFNPALGDVIAGNFQVDENWREYKYGEGREVYVRDRKVGSSYYQVGQIRLFDNYVLGMIKDQSTGIVSPDKFEKALTGFLALGFLIFLILFIVIIKLLTHPLRSISKAAKDITNGEYGVNIKPELTFINEVGDLGRSFNEMSTELKRRSDENETSSCQLQQFNVEMEKALDKLKLKYQEVRNLNNISYQLHKIYDNDKIVSYALEHIRMTNDLQLATAYLREETGDRFFVLGSSGMALNAAPPDEILIQCINSGRPTLEMGVPSSEPPTMKRLIIPVELGERTNGVLLLESSRADEFDDERIDYFFHLASHIFSIVRNKLLLQDSLKRTEELRRINRISERISGELDLKRLFDEIARAVRSSLGADACVVLTRETDGVLKARSVETENGNEEIPLEKITNGILRHIIDSREPLLISDASRDQRLGDNSALSEQGYRSFIGTPMFYQGGLIGVICAVDRGVATFDERDVSFLSTVGNQTATALENATLFEIIKERDSRRQIQLNVAQKFQRDRIPSYFEKGKIEIHSTIVPAEELAGDFFDVFSLGPSTIAFVIGDVATKGIPASLMTFSLLSMFRKDAKTMRSPTRVLEAVNQNVSAQVKEDTWFTTCFYGKLNTNDLTLVYAKAGHELPLLHRRRTGEITTLDANGIPLGIYPNAQYEARQVTLEHGDRLILYTDGVVEAINSAGERFSRNRLMALVESKATMRAKDLSDAIVEEVNVFTGGGKPSDDILVAVLEVKADPWVHKTIYYRESGDLINEIMEQLKLYNLESPVIYAIRLSLDESLANAHRHGNQGNSDVQIKVSFLITQEQFCVRVRDAGYGFNYESLPDPTVEENLFKSSGRGVFLMRQMLDDVEYNEMGNEIMIVKYFSLPEEGEDLL